LSPSSTLMRCSTMRAGGHSGGHSRMGRNELGIEG
jgi:hypothetical protein